jgi:hypothetical protein
VRLNYLIRTNCQSRPPDESGATAIECGIVAAGISLAIMIIVNAPGRGDFHQHQVRGNHRAAEVATNNRKPSPTLVKAEGLE